MPPAYPMADIAPPVPHALLPAQAWLHDGKRRIPLSPFFFSDGRSADPQNIRKHSLAQRRPVDSHRPQGNSLPQVAQPPQAPPKRRFASSSSYHPPPSRSHGYRHSINGRHGLSPTTLPRPPRTRQPELWPRPSRDAAGCGAVAADTCTGGVGLRPPCYGYQQACEDEAGRCGR